MKNKAATEYKKSLERLTTVVCQFQLFMDEAMKGPSTFERGKEIARLMNALCLQNQLEMRNVLDYSFGKIERLSTRKKL